MKKGLFPLHFHFLIDLQEIGLGFVFNLSWVLDIRWGRAFTPGSGSGSGICVYGYHHYCLSHIKFVSFNLSLVYFILELLICSTWILRLCLYMIPIRILPVSAGELNITCECEYEKCECGKRAKRYNVMNRSIKFVLESPERHTATSSDMMRK